MRIAFRGGAANLDNNEITVSNGPKWEIADLDAATLPYRAARAADLSGRAAAASASGLNPAWWASRERTEGKPDSVRLAECGTHVVRLLNTETGEIIEQIQGCGHPLCKPCAKRRAGKLSRRLSNSIAQLENELRQQEVREKARHRAGYLITLTVRHCGSIALDIERLALAWANFRASWKAMLGERFSYVRFLEVASKKSKGGHAHWHMLAWWPIAEWGRLQRWWRKAIATVDKRLGIEWPTERQRRNAGNLEIEKAQRSAAAYCAKARKYASKSAVDVSGMELDAVAAMIAKLKSARRVSASVGFWATREFFTVWTVLDKADMAQPAPARGWWREVAPAQGPPKRTCKRRPAVVA